MSLGHSDQTPPAWPIVFGPQTVHMNLESSRAFIFHGLQARCDATHMLREGPDVASRWAGTPGAHIRLDTWGSEEEPYAIWQNSYWPLLVASGVPLSRPLDVGPAVDFADAGLDGVAPEGGSRSSRIVSVRARKPFPPPAGAAALHLAALIAGTVQDSKGQGLSTPRSQ
jgi:hypothetical protein